MAYDSKNISPLDLKKSVSIGVKVPFSDPSVFKRVYTTKEQLKYNIINFLMTDKRERIFSPSFGAGLRRRIFSQMTENTEDEIQLSLTSQLESYFPNILVNKLLVTSNEDKNTIKISLSYYIKNTKENDNILVNIQNQL